MGDGPAGERPAAERLGVHVIEVREERIAEDATLVDQLGLMEQLGHTLAD